MTSSVGSHVFDRVLVAMGPWSGLLAKSLGTPNVQGLKAHSVVLEPP